MFRKSARKWIIYWKRWIGVSKTTQISSQISRKRWHQGFFTWKRQKVLRGSCSFIKRTTSFCSNIKPELILTSHFLRINKRILIFLSTDSSRTSSLVGSPSQVVPPEGNGVSLSEMRENVSYEHKQYHSGLNLPRCIVFFTLPLLIFPAEPPAEKWYEPNTFFPIYTVVTDSI